MNRISTFKISTLLTGILMGTMIYAPESTAQCVPTFSDGCDQGVDINDFVISGEESTSINDNNTYCSPGSYYDNTSTPMVSLASGTSYSATISTMYSEPGDGSYAVVWIDLNDDGVFSEAERVAMSTSLISSTGTTLTINIPSGASLGNKIMRVMLGYAMGEDGTLISPTSFNPCNDGPDALSMGEVHDYLISVVPNPLPVSITSLKAIKQGNEHLITWTTVSENNNSKFNILYSNNGINFEKIEELASKATNGNSNESIQYSFKTNERSKSSNFYQLEQVDINGKVSKTSVIKVENGVSETAFTLSPNPAKGILNIQSLNQNVLPIEISIFNITGSKVFNNIFQSDNINVDIQHLPAGLYVAQIKNDNKIHTIKFTKE